MDGSACANIPDYNINRIPAVRLPRLRHPDFRVKRRLFKGRLHIECIYMVLLRDKTMQIDILVDLPDFVRTARII